MKNTSRYGVHTPDLPKNLVKVDFEAQEEPGEYYRVLLANENLTGRELPRLVFEQVHWRHGVFLQARLPGLRASDCCLEHCDFSGARLEKARLKRIEFSGCRLLGTDFLEGVFEDLLFKDCIAEDCHFALASFRAARFEKCAFPRASFESADLSGAVFDGCDLTGANFRGAKLEGADLSTAKIDALQIGVKELQGAIIAPWQAAQVVSLLGIVIKDGTEDPG
jgi:uncharacterized protein YjbI with pentapeptide repeats